MSLPQGVVYRPRQLNLISKDQEAIIKIDCSPRYAINQGYRITEYDYQSGLLPFLHGDWKRFDERYEIGHERSIHKIEGVRNSPVFYSVAEHLTISEHPTITVVANLSAQKAGTRERPWKIFGCTFGHYFSGGPYDDSAQEIYEFQSFGMIFIARPGKKADLWVAREGDKVAVPRGSFATLYNLGDEDNPLVTLSFANRETNQKSREIVSQLGPPLLAYYDDTEVVFTLNRLYIQSVAQRGQSASFLSRIWNALSNFSTGKASRMNESHLKDFVQLNALDPSAADRDEHIIIKRYGRFDIGRLLYEHLTQSPDIASKFALIGLSVKRASRDVALTSAPSSDRRTLYSSRPLIEAAREGTEVYRYFFPAAERGTPGQPDSRGLAAMAIEVAKGKEKLLRFRPLKSPLIVVVEGVGDWVEKAYRNLFAEINAEIRESHLRLQVFYADDSRWKSARPEWVNPNNQNYLRDWEKYLDKADPEDYVIYEGLRSYADMVFIVTPDSTHCEIARSWLADTSLIFVEKPFDSHPSNVEQLLLELGKHPNKVILGLDHYLFYAMPVYEMIGDIETHLGGTLASITFYMTESGPVEAKRLRSLQHGLTLDLLPHLLALLIYFGHVRTVDDIRVVEAGQHMPLPGSFKNETYSQVGFTFQDYSGNGFNIPCLAVVGKGLMKDVKYMEVAGSNGNSIRIDLTPRPESEADSSYPWDSLFFMQHDGASLPPNTSIKPVADPHNPARTLSILRDDEDPNRFCKQLARSRYRKLIKELMEGKSTALSTTLSVGESTEIVGVLDRVWGAVQEAKPWVQYNLQEFFPETQGGTL